MKARKCQIEKCKEDFSKKVWCLDLDNLKGKPEVVRLCEGHAFILLGRIYGNAYMECPVCHVMVPNNANDKTKT